MGIFDRILAQPRATDDFSDQYNTALNDDEEMAFRRWAERQAASTGRDPRRDLYDYDVYGFWKSGDYSRTDERGHGSDRWKKPNHPTFSDQSMYSGQNDYIGGKWDATSFTPSMTNLQFRSPMQLYKYFRDVEPGIELILPKGM